MNRLLVFVCISVLAYSDAMADKVYGAYGDEADEIARSNATSAALKVCRDTVPTTDEQKAECARLWKTPEGVRWTEEWKARREATVPKALRDCIDRKPMSDRCAKMIADDFAQMQKRAKAEQAARPGAKLGMTREEVRMKSSWGAPLKINQTITKNGVSEQWVYEGSQYLYFEDGILTAIQTTSR